VVDRAAGFNIKDLMEGIPLWRRQRCASSSTGPAQKVVREGFAAAGLATRQGALPAPGYRGALPLVGASTYRLELVYTCGVPSPDKLNPFFHVTWRRVLF